MPMTKFRSAQYRMAQGILVQALMALLFGSAIALGQPVAWPGVAAAQGSCRQPSPEGCNLSFDVPENAALGEPREFHIWRIHIDRPESFAVLLLPELQTNYDLYVYTSDLSLVGQSLREETTSQWVLVADPSAEDYLVYVASPTADAGGPYTLIAARETASELAASKPFSSEVTWLLRIPDDRPCRIQVTGVDDDLISIYSTDGTSAPTSREDLERCEFGSGFKLIVVRSDRSDGQDRLMLRLRVTGVPTATPTPATPTPPPQVSLLLVGTNIPQGQQLAPCKGDTIFSALVEDAYQTQGHVAIVLRVRNLEGSAASIFRTVTLDDGRGGRVPMLSPADAVYSGVLGTLRSQTPDLLTVETELEAGGDARVLVVFQQSPFPPNSLRLVRNPQC